MLYALFVAELGKLVSFWERWQIVGRFVFCCTRGAVLWCSREKAKSHCQRQPVIGQMIINEASMTPFPEIEFQKTHVFASNKTNPGFVLCCTGVVICCTGVVLCCMGAVLCCIWDCAAQGLHSAVEGLGGLGMGLGCFGMVCGGFKCFGDGFEKMAPAN